MEKTADRKGTIEKTTKKTQVSRVNCYAKKEFEALANAVNTGMPVKEAEEIIQREKELGAVGVEYFWAKIKKDSSIRIKCKTINKIKELQEEGYERTYDLIINKLIQGNPKANKIIKDIEKIEKARNRIESGKFTTQAEARKKHMRVD